MNHETCSDCRSETGITVGLVDTIITTLHVLKSRDLSAPEVQEALKELQQHEMTQQIFVERKSNLQIMGRLSQMLIPGLILCVERKTKQILDHHPATYYPMVCEDNTETVKVLKELFAYYTQRAIDHCKTLSSIDDCEAVLSELDRMDAVHNLWLSSVGEVGFDVYAPPTDETSLKELVNDKNLLRQEFDLMYKAGTKIIGVTPKLSEANKGLLVNSSALKSGCILIRFIEAIEQQSN